MKKIILSLLLALSYTNTCFANTDQFYEQSLSAVSKHQRVNVRPYLNASYHVAKMWKQFPHADFHQRVACYIGWGGMESGFEKDYIHYNIPHKPYPGLNGLKVKKFSVDYSWAGLNEGAVIPSYTVARALQTGRVMSRKELRQLGMHPALYVELKKVLKVPQDLSLFQIDLTTAPEAKRQYLEQVKRKVKPTKISISVPYEEDTQDKIDSVLLYRTIWEYDRYLRKWPWKSYKSEAYYICQDILNK